MFTSTIHLTWLKHHWEGILTYSSTVYYQDSTHPLRKGKICLSNHFSEHTEKDVLHTSVTIHSRCHIIDWNMQAIAFDIIINKTQSYIFSQFYFFLPLLPEPAFSHGQYCVAFSRIRIYFVDKKKKKVFKQENTF